MNNELDAEFDIAKFDHFGTYNVKLGAMESFLLSKEQQSVRIGSLNKTFHFKPYEPIHVEFSFKFLPAEVQQLGHETGFETIACFYDSKKYFLNTVLQVIKG